jgi:hypothetical protein
MISDRIKWLNIALLVAAAIELGILLRVMTRKGLDAAMTSQAGPIILVAGDPLPRTGAKPKPYVVGPRPLITAPLGRPLDIPIYLFDTTTQSLIVYLYNPVTNSLVLNAARKVADDLGIEQYSNDGFSVEKIKRDFEKALKRKPR